MDATMVMMADDPRMVEAQHRQAIEEVVYRVGDEGIIVVQSGKAFAKNMGRAFRLPRLNRNRLVEIVDELVKRGVIVRVEVLFQDDDECADGRFQRRSTEREYLYHLAE